jgi:DNA-binding transcriptional ArsR family regulator
MTDAFGVVALDPPIRNFEIKDVETLRLVADPTRLAILRVLMNDIEFTPRVMSAKELAAELEQPQTKLYRHLKQLEDAGLIQVAETRLVSGIVEQRYRAAQMAIGMSPELVVDPAMQNESVTLAASVFTDFRDELLANVRKGRLRIQPEEPYKGVIFQSGTVRVSAAKADEIRKRLADAIADLMHASDPDGVQVEMLVAFYAINEDSVS